MKSSVSVRDSEQEGSEGSDWTRHQVTDPQRESGIPPARLRHPAERSLVDDGDEHVQLALAESTRTEANLGSLLRGLQHLAAGATAARDANLTLFHELEKVRALLGQSSAEERVLRQRLRILEQSLECNRQYYARRRATFIEQEDAFLVELLGDHQREVADLRAQLGDALALRVPSSDSIVPASNPPSTLASLKLRTITLPLPAAGSPPRPSSRPPLKQKADPSTRPLVEYSLGKSEVAVEHVTFAPGTDTPRTNR